MNQTRISPVRQVPRGSAEHPKEEKPRFLISDLCVYLEHYLEVESIREVYRAYLFGAEAHEGHYRKSGEPYIYHPIAVALILAEMRMDHRCIMAALLHDVIEDTRFSKEQLADAFGKEIAELVDGVSKIAHFEFKSRAEAKTATLHKMLLAMTKDIRVILIKLADRLHNMRTLGAMAPAKRRRISRETLEVYAPIAKRLGMDSIRTELENLSFEHHWPWRYRVLCHSVHRTRTLRKEVIANIHKILHRRLQQEGITGEVLGRQKELYSIYRKMREDRRPFKEMDDLFGFRILVDRVDTCYRALGLVHDCYKPLFGRFRDYIAIPKENGYQSLHSTLFGPHGVPIEIQIRTRDMDRIAEAGIAAHWMYKLRGQLSDPRTLAADWLQNLLELQRSAGDSPTFLEQARTDLFPDTVYVFTPGGDIQQLPRGATAIDFAYAIHSDIGNSCSWARVDRRMASLDTVLSSGQTVDILTSPNARPRPEWLKFAVTGKARTAIRASLKNMQQQEARQFGQRLLEAELARYQTGIASLPQEALARYLKQANLPDLPALLVEIGLGNRMSVLVARQLAGSMPPEARDPAEAASGKGDRPLAIKGTEGLVVHYARCCYPIPGDGIVGLFNPGKGIVIHRRECHNLGDIHRHKDHWLDLDWAHDPGSHFLVAICIEVGNRRGVLATIASTIAEQETNVENVQSRDKDGFSSFLDFWLSVRNRAHLAQIIRRLRHIPPVMRIARHMH